VDHVVQIIAVTVAVSFAALPGATSPPSYIGILYGHKTATVRLVQVASMTAVWLGASTRSITWIQAGLEGAHPNAYIETGRNGHQTSLRRWPVPAGHLAHIRLQHVKHRWRVIIDGQRSRWLRLRHAISITVLETNGPAIAYINGKLIVGG